MTRGRSGFEKTDYVRRQGVAEKVIDGHLVLVDELEAELVQLNPTGGRIWELLSPGRDMSAVLDLLSTEFAVPRSSLQADLRAFIKRLRQLGLIEECSRAG